MLKTQKNINLFKYIGDVDDSGCECDHTIV